MDAVALAETVSTGIPPSPNTCGVVLPAKEALGCKSATRMDVVSTGLDVTEETFRALRALKLNVPVDPLLIGGETLGGKRILRD